MCFRQLTPQKTSNEGKNVIHKKKIKKKENEKYCDQVVIK